MKAAITIVIAVYVMCVAPQARAISPHEPMVGQGKHLECVNFLGDVYCDWYDDQPFDLQPVGGGIGR